MTTFNSLDEVHTAIQGMTNEELTQLIKLAEKEYNDNIITKEQAMETIEYALIVLLGKFELPKH
jgi:hypothetical protein